MESKLKDCMERNERRRGKEKIPRTAIAATLNRLELPSYGECFNALYFVQNDGETMIVLEWKA